VRRSLPRVSKKTKAKRAKATGVSRDKAYGAARKVAKAAKTKRPTMKENRKPRAFKQRRLQQRRPTAMSRRVNQKFRRPRSSRKPTTTLRVAVIGGPRPIRSRNRSQYVFFLFVPKSLLRVLAFRVLIFFLFHALWYRNFIFTSVFDLVNFN
jgi:hypothetical protein